ncbi:tyrosine-type recombinase/integrase [Cupriavidus necator]|uniref:tyrosine-type recombinase/integrase n=1 Tax=Cupriavidus necator TaxID=106590 RepID=UPI0039C45CF7
MGQTPLLRARICSPPQCNRQPHGDSAGRHVAPSVYSSQTSSIHGSGSTALAGRGIGTAGGLAVDAAAALGWVFHCLIGLLSVTGLRISEALNLELGDVDLEDAVLTIRGAKLGRSRLVPIHPTTCAVLADYLRRRKQFLGCRVSSYVFVTSRGTRLDMGRVHRTFYALSRQRTACRRRKQGAAVA